MSTYEIPSSSSQRPTIVDQLYSFLRRLGPLIPLPAAGCGRRPNSLWLVLTGLALLGPPRRHTYAMRVEQLSRLTYTSVETGTAQLRDGNTLDRRMLWATAILRSVATEA